MRSSVLQRLSSRVVLTYRRYHLHGVIIAVMGMALSVALVQANEKKRPNANKRAFDRAQLAATAETWDAAIAILDKIDIEKIDDVEVIEYIQFSKLCSSTAEALGISRKANPDSPTDVIIKIEWSKLIVTLAEKAATSPVKFAGLLKDARKVQNGIPRYQELNSKLTERYANANFEELPDRLPILPDSPPPTAVDSARTPDPAKTPPSASSVPWLWIALLGGGIVIAGVLLLVRKRTGASNHP